MTIISVQQEDHHVSRRSLLPGPYQALQGNRNLTLLFCGQTVSALGDWLYLTVLVVLVYTVTRSAVLAAALTGVRLLPYVLVLPLGGALADRYNRRSLMIVADVGRAACMLGMLGLFAVGSASTVWLAFPLVFLTTIGSSLFRPALSATLPSVARGTEDLARANALMSQIDALAFVIGPALGGTLLLLGAARLALAINAGTYVISALSLIALRLPDQPIAEIREETSNHSSGWWSEMTVGFRVLFCEKGGALGAVTLGQAALSAFSAASWTLLVVLAEQTWHLGSQGAGFLLTAYGAGAIGGGFIVGTLTRRLGAVGGFVVSLAVAAGAVLLLGISPAGLLPFLLLAIFGLADIANQVVATTLLQVGTPPALLGRVFGAFEATLVGSALMGALLVGPLIDGVGPRATVVLLALPAVALTLGVISRRRNFEHRKPTSDTAVPAA